MNITDYEWSKDVAACQDSIDTINWRNVQAYASKLHDEKPCNAEAPIGMGGRHFVRILTFEGGERWLARFPIHSDDTNDSAILREADCLRIIAERSTVPVPSVFAAVPREPKYGAAFILMECLPGNVGTDINDGLVPEQHKAMFFRQMADAQVQISSIVFPRIGTPVRLRDGTTSIGPIPGIGGPFDTASAFYRAWAATATFPLPEEKVKRDCGAYGDEIWESIRRFPARLSQLADQIAGPYDDGPFPLVHVDYGHNNIVVDAHYDMLGVIDWENAIAAPLGMVEYPLTVRAIPVSMEVPWNYSSDGSPKHADLMSQHKDREEYLQAMINAERELGIQPKLSEVLRNEAIRDIAAAMKLFSVDGKMGWYSRVLDVFESVAGS